MSDSVWPHGQTPLSMGFSRQEYWSGLPCPRPGDLPDPGIELASLASPVLTGGFFTTSTTWEAPPYGCVLVAQSCPTLWNPMDCSLPGSSVHGKDTGVGCYFLFQRIFLTQELNLGLSQCRQILYLPNYKGSPQGLYCFKNSLKVFFHIFMWYFYSFF